MTTAGSTATLSEIGTPPPANGKDLELLFLGPAPRHDGKNLLIKIDIGSDEATFHCLEPEHVGTHKKRHVLFCADQHCWLIFSNSALFNADYLELQPNIKTQANVSDTFKGETRCGVRVEVAKTARVTKMATKPEMASTTASKFHGPVIVVP